MKLPKKGLIGIGEVGEAMFFTNCSSSRALSNESSRAVLEQEIYLDKHSGTINVVLAIGCEQLKNHCSYRRMVESEIRSKIIQVI